MKAIGDFPGRPPGPPAPDENLETPIRSQAFSRPERRPGLVRIEALGIGLALWGIGGALTVGFAGHPAALAIAYLCALACFPALVPLARWHLRHVAAARRHLAGLHLSGAILAVQFGLDAIAFASAPYVAPGIATPTFAASLVPPLLLAYCAFLVVPWAVSAR